MTQKTPVSLFNSTLHELIDDVKFLDKDNQNLHRFKDSLDILKVNVRLYLNLYRKYILTDENRFNIFQENETFFLNNNYEEYTHNREHFEIMINLKNLWNKITDDNHQKIFNYFKILTYYSDQDLGINTELEIKRVNSLYLSNADGKKNLNI